jgi:hypothetical protein
MSNPPPPVKVNPYQVRKAPEEEPPPATSASYTVPTIPTAPSYEFPNPPDPELRIVSGKFLYGTQTFNIIKYLNANRYAGYVEYPVKKLVNDLRDDGLITEPDNPDTLKLKPPTAVVQWIDPDGYHTKEFGMEQIIIMGKLSAWGLLMKKPSELSWKAALAAGTVQFWLTVAVFWLLMVIWAFMLWRHILNSGLNLSTATETKFGKYGVWFALVAGLVGQFGPTAYIMAFLAALAPVWSFAIQFTFWWFVESQLPEKGMLPGAAASSSSGFSFPKFPTMPAATAASESSTASTDKLLGAFARASIF